MARQGHAFATSDEVRVVYQQQDDEPLDAELRDVPSDGKTLGEIVVRGNIVMKEVSLECLVLVLVFVFVWGAECGVRVLRMCADGFWDTVVLPRCRGDEKGV